MRTKKSKINKESGRELIYENRYGLESLQQNFDYVKNVLQEIIKEYSAVTNTIISIGEIEALIKDKVIDNSIIPQTELIEASVRKQLVRNMPAFSGKIKFDQQKLMDLIAIPDLTRLMAAFNKLRTVPMINFREVIFWDCYDLNKGTIVLMPDMVEKQKDSYCFYAVTLHEKQKLSQVRDLCDCLTKIYAENKQDVTPDKFIIHGMVFFDPDTESYKPSDIFIKYGLNQTIRV